MTERSTFALSNEFAKLRNSVGIRQIVYGQTTTPVTTSSSGFSDTGVTATITPTSLSNKILVIASLNGGWKETGNTYSNVRLKRDATVVLNIHNAAGYSSDALDHTIATLNTVYEETAPSTSALTYKLEFNSAPNIAKISFNLSSTLSSIILMEIVR